MTETDWKWMGLRMRDVRQQRHISQKELAEMIHMNSSSLSNIEHNRCHTTLETVVDIAAILDISLDYIIRGIRPLFNTSGLIFRSDDDLEQSLLLTEE